MGWIHSSDEGKRKKNSQLDIHLIYIKINI